MPILGSNAVCGEICDVLGLKHVIRLDLHMALKEIVTIQAEFYPEIEGIRQLKSIIKDYELIEKKSNREVL